VRYLVFLWDCLCGGFVPARVLEEKLRFSSSLLWTLQDSAYTHLGPSAWSEGLVPSYITSNPFIAKKYAALAAAYIRDNQIDPSEPIYLFDLGGGSGRFAYLFLKAFQGANFRYVMTDIVESTLTFWQNQASLKPFENLDFALYRHDQKGGGIKLKSGRVITKTKNPVILIANYYFDTIPQDLFRVHEGRLEEGRISLSVPEGVEWERSDPRCIPHLECHFDYVPFNEGDYAKEVVSVLKSYRKDATFLLPTGGFESLQFFKQLAGKFLLLAGDQGVSSEEQVVQWGEPKITKHTTFSIAVNYHGLATYFRQNGGLAFLSTFPDPVFANIAAAWGAKDLPELKRVFESDFDPFDPKDYFLLVSEADKQKELSLDYLFLLLKLGDWDPINLHHFFPHILAKIPGASEQQKRDWTMAVDKVFEQVYVISKEEGDFIMNLGVLLYEMGEYQKALEYFHRSLEITGEKRQTLINIAACQKHLRNKMTNG
jgi:Tetratricopeptide repeat